MTGGMRSLSRRARVDGLEEPAQAAQNGLLAEEGDDVEERGADGDSGQGEASRVDELARRDPRLFGDGAESRLERLRGPGVERLVARGELFQERRRLGLDLF